MPDYSCYITISNKLNVPLTLVGDFIWYGQWVGLGSNSTVQAGTKSSTIQLKNGLFDPVGAKGSFTYSVRIPGMNQINFNCAFECPVIGSNQFGTHLSGYHGLFALSNTLITSGHPLRVEVTIDYNRSLPFSTSIQSLGLVRFAVPVVNTRNYVNIPEKDNVTKDIHFEMWNPKVAESVKDTSDPRIAGSYNCVSTAFQDTSNFYASLSSSGNSDIDQIPVKLQGAIGSTIIFEEPDVKMNQTNTMTIFKRYSDSPFGYAGDVTWSVIIQHTGQAVPLSASTRIEVHCISSYTANVSCFTLKGLDVRLLRLLVLPGFSKYIVSMTTALMNTGYKYDNVMGGSGFGTNSQGGNFQLRSWLDNLSTLTQPCNCYDQAALVQIGAWLLIGNDGQSAGGGPSATTKVWWAYLQPFGYINDTYLLGRGLCNNPFYGNPRINSRMIVDINDPRRSGFSNHAFIRCTSFVDPVPYPGQTLDATSGPHTNTEYVSDYLSNAIDTSTTLYTRSTIQQWPNGWGTADPPFLSWTVGIAYLNQPTSMSMEFSLPAPVKDAVDGAMNSAEASTPPPVKHSNAPVSSFPSVIETQIPQISCSKKERYVDASGTQVEWFFTTSPNRPIIRVSVAVFPRHDIAVNAMRHELATFQLPADQIFQAPAVTGRGQYELESIAEGQNVILVRGNILLRARCMEAVPGEDIDVTLTTQVVDIIVDGLKQDEVDPPDWLAPNPEPISDVPGTVQVGERFTLSAPVADVAESNGRTHTGSVLMIEKDETSKAFTFVGRKAGKDTITLTFAHRDTLAVATQEFEVEVIEEGEA